MDKWDELAARMEKCGLREEDILEKFILGSGKGGQKINKTASCVYLKHIPSGIEVKCQENRSRDINRLLARRNLCSKLEELLFKKKSDKQQLFEKVRRQKRRRSRKQKEKMLEGKRKRSDLKTSRKTPGF